MREKGYRQSSISPLKKNHIILMQESSLIKKSQQIIMNSSNHPLTSNNPMILKKFEEYFNNHPVKDLKMIQTMIHKNSIFSKSKDFSTNTLLQEKSSDDNIKQYELVGINTLRKKKQSNTVIVCSQKEQRQDKKLILNKPNHMFSDNQMNFNIKPVNTRNTYSQIKNITTESKRKLKMATSVDISKYINQINTQEEEFQKIKQSFQQNQLIKLYKRKSSQVNEVHNEVSQNRPNNSTTLQQNRLFNSTTLQQTSNKFISKRIISKHKLQQSYRDSAKFRCLSPFKKQIKISIMEFLNPLKKTQFIQKDLHQSIAFVNNVKIKSLMNGSFFNVYIQQGNNSQLLKAIIRSVCGWRVVELPQTANFIWTQVYKKKTVEKRPNKMLKDQIIQDQNDKLRSNSKANMNNRNNSQLRKSQKMQDIQKFEAYIASIKSQVTFQNQLKKILPDSVNPQTFIPLNRKANQLVITQNFLIHNHLPDHKCISDKKNLLKNLKAYYQNKGVNPFDFLPQSYHMSSRQEQIMQKLKHKDQNKQVWLIKPGQDSNRGRGIVITKGYQQTDKQIHKRFQGKSQKQKQGITQNMIPQKRQKSVILQRYILPLLYNQRKFDIRSYMLVTVVNNNINAYFYEECYLRTSSKPFDIKSLNKYIHLTNDAIQCSSNDYGKYQEGNKLSENQFRKYLAQDIKLKKYKGVDFVKNMNEDCYWDVLKQQMAQRCKDIMGSTSKQLFQSTKSLKNNFSKTSAYHNFFTRSSSPNNAIISRSPKNLINDKISPFSQKIVADGTDFPIQNDSNSPIFFELFGLDFLIDQSYKLWLIQVNTNPAITHDCSRVLNRLIPKLLQNTFSVAVMPYMKPSRLSESSYNNQFVNIYSQTFPQ